MSAPTLFNIGVRSAAVISSCGLYRYTLTRGACHGTDAVNFVMLNPSKADHEKNDQTIRRCLGYAKDWGYADLVVTNLFALRSTDPKALATHPDPIGPENDCHIIEQAMRCSAVIVAWGADPMATDRSRAVWKLLQSLGVKPQALRVTASGAPAHPSRLPNGLVPVPWEPRLS